MRLKSGIIYIPHHDFLRGNEGMFPADRRGESQKYAKWRLDTYYRLSTRNCLLPKKGELLLSVSSFFSQILPI